MHQRLDHIFLACYIITYFHVSLIISPVTKCTFSNISNFLYLVHPCDKANNGGCSQICNKRNEKHECSCEPGFVLENNTTCKKGQLRCVKHILRSFLSHQLVYTFLLVMTYLVSHFQCIRAINQLKEDVVKFVTRENNCIHALAKLDSC